MATTEQWIEWSKRYAQREWSINHQLFLEVAMLATRHTRDSVPGASEIPELANADHYWLSRYLCFLAAGSTGRTVGTGGDLLSPAFGQILMFATSYTVGGLFFIPNTIMAGVWDLLKRGARLINVAPPGGGARASQPSDEQVQWAMKGHFDSLSLDVPYAEQMVFNFALNEYNWQSRPFPPPPNS
jgi:hypothetical protein